MIYSTAVKKMDFGKIKLAGIDLDGKLFTNDTKID